MSSIGNDVPLSPLQSDEPGSGEAVLVGRTLPTGEYVRDYVQRLRGGEMGAIPASSAWSCS